MSIKTIQELAALGGACVSGDVIRVDLWYPGVEGNPTAVEVDLMHVRASDGLRISFDFERNGWSIKQASTFQWEPGDEVQDSDWQEVAFVHSWARDKHP